MAVPVSGGLEHCSTTSTTTSADVSVAVVANATAVVFNKTTSWCPDTPPFLGKFPVLYGKVYVKVNLHYS